MSKASQRSDDEHAALVRSVAVKLRAQLDLGPDLDDLVGAGYAGLVEAQTRFDPTRGVLFSTFAHYRIRGAMIDHLRKSSNLSRRAYQRLRHAEASDGVAEQVAELRGADPASRTDVTQTVKTLDDTLHKLTASYVLACLGQDPSQAEPDPEMQLLENEAATRIRSAVESLPERERAMIEGHYFQGRRMDEISAELGVSKSWGSRIHGKALERLRDALDD